MEERGMTKKGGGVNDKRGRGRSHRGGKNDTALIFLSRLDTRFQSLLPSVQNVRLGSGLQ